VSPLNKTLLSGVLLAAFFIALQQGVAYGPESTFWGVILSSFLWLLASLIPTWWNKATSASAAFNSSAAAAAVFAGLTALPHCLMPHWALELAHAAPAGKFCPAAGDSFLSSDRPAAVAVSRIQPTSAP
jgi:hypothetical protein